MDYTKHLTSTVDQPILGANQILNSTGGYVYQLNDFDALDRFLIIGTEGGTYYAKEQDITRQCFERVLNCINVNGLKAIKRIVEISEQGRAPKNDPAIFALALAAKKGNEPTRRAAFEAMPKVCRTGTHLLHFVKYVDHLGGWGRGTKSSVAKWLLDKDEKALAYQLIKYQQRDRFSMRDALRLSHPKPTTMEQQALFKYVAKGAEKVIDDVSIVPDKLRQVWAFEEIKKSPTVEKAIKLITDYNLPREVVPTEFLQYPQIWEALFPSMGITALIRNLGNMTKCGFLGSFSKNTAKAIEKLTDQDLLIAGRVHPLNIVTAFHTYSQGKGAKGSGVWEPIGKIVEALNSAFYLSFKTVTPTNKNILLGLDVSASMDCGNVAGLAGLTPRDISSVMALITASVEPNCELVAFTGEGLQRLAITQSMGFGHVKKYLSSFSFGATDCSMPMKWAQKNDLKVDAFVIYTDNEVNCGDHPSIALDKYRRQSGIKAKSIVCGMTATNFTIADPHDPLMLDVVGFDSAAPQIISEFIA